MMINKKNKFSLKSLFKSGKELIKNNKNIQICLLYVCGAIIYLFSLDSIEGVDMKCYWKFNLTCIYILVILTCISSVLITFSIYMILLRNYKKVHLFVIFVICLFFYFIDHNNTITRHGLYNFIAFLLFTIILFIMCCLLHLLYHLFKKRNFLIILLILFSFCYLIYYLKRYKLNHFSCENWAKGLNNSCIDNISKDYPCVIDLPQPHSCYLSDIGPYFDFTSIYKQNCLDLNLIKFEKEKFLKDIQILNLKYFELSEKNHFGYPLTNNEDFTPDLYGSMIYPGNTSFEDTINQKIILMDLYNKDKEKYYPNKETPEIEVILTEDAGKIVFNIRKNETLIKEREEIINKNKNKPIYKNVLIMFLDTLSRAHFFRKFPKTIKFFENFSKYEKNPLKKNMTVFQYFKYNSLNSYTDPNLKATYYGATIDGKGVHFANYFSKNGYIIGRVNAYCEKESAFHQEEPSKLKHAVWDHEGLSLACIKAFYDRFLVSRLNSLIKKCLFGKDLNQYGLEYLEIFWRNYLDQHKLFLFQTEEGHEPTGELIGHFDEILFDFLNNFYKKGYFKDTVLLIFSDHGQHLNGPLYLFDSQDFIYEKTLPALFIMLPNDEKLYKDNLFEKMKSNQQTFITAFDIYNTLIYLSSGDNKEEYERNKISFGGSLFIELNYEERYCQSPMYKPQLEKFICRCKLK